MFFTQTIKDLCKLSQFSIEQIQELTEILKSEALLPDDFFKMTNHFGSILHSIPDILYMEMIRLTQVFTSELIALGRMNDTEKKDEIGLPHLVIVTINLNLAYKLESLGLYGEAHKALLKTKDPWVIPYDSSTKKGDLYLSRSLDVDHYLIDIGYIFPDVIKRFFVSRAALGFRLSKIMGDVGGESHEAYNRYKIFTKLVNPEQHDLLFFTNYLDLLNPALPEAKEIVNLLLSCHGNEENTNYRFLIASCLAGHLKSAEWTSRATAEVDTFYWAELFHMKVLEACDAGWYTTELPDKNWAIWNDEGEPPYSFKVIETWEETIRYLMDLFDGSELPEHHWFPEGFDREEDVYKTPPDKEKRL